IGKKTCRLFATGGDDQKVNVWSIGKSTSLMGLSGHASPVESVTFNSAEVLVLAGASAGVVKLWDLKKQRVSCGVLHFAKLEGKKVVRTLTGHRSNCTAVEFHPFGEFFASGATDTNLKVWDIRKKGCIHTYKGHTQGISAVKFTPDGRWVVSAFLIINLNFDGVVFRGQVWDLTAGKLLHDFKFHEGHIRSLDFHPLEFLLATGSADRTVKFWDLETFELIGSVRPEATGVRSITFHPDGRTLFCGLDDSLKVYSWEPIVCHDAVDMGWSALGDLCIHDGNLMGCSYFRNSVAVWAADISLIKPYGVGLLPEQDSQFEQKHDLQESPLRKVGSHRRTASSLRCSSPEYETKEIKTIYVDSESPAGANPVASKRAGSYTSPKVVPPSDSKEMNSLPNQKQSPAVGVHAKSVGQTNAKSFIVPSVVPRDCPDGKDSTNARRESNTSARAGIGMPLRPPHVRRPSATKFDADMLSVPSESEPYRKTTVDTAVDPTFHDRLVADDNAKDTSAEKHLDIKSVAQKFDKVLSPKTPSSKKNCPESLNGTEGTKAVKYVNGVAVVRGRTRSLVERFEMKERSSTDEFQAPDTSPESLSEVAKTSPMLNGHPPITGQELPSSNAGNLTVDVIGIGIRSGANNSHPQMTGQKVPSANDVNHTEDLMQNHDVLLSTLRSRLTKLQVVRHFWERNDIKGAIDAVKKFPDHSVQADLISILMEKMEILSLDLFSCLLPVLLCLLDSKIERHGNISLEMLLKLVAVFGPVVRSTISAPPAVGVDLHAEQRLKCCNQCSIQLQKIQNILPVLVRYDASVSWHY
ncbi:hypothetical protein C3L33_06271, partial [Rhododendron williamsianum]